MLFLAYSFLLLAFLLFMMNVTDRFLKYVGYGTQSDPNTGLNPSTPGQMEFAHVEGRDGSYRYPGGGTG